MADKLSIEELLSSGQTYVGPTFGTSMQPVIFEGKTSIVVEPKTERLKKFDVVLFRHGDKYILHRIIKVYPEGYFTRGDNCIQGEWVLEKDALGVLKEFYVEDKHVLCTDKKYNRYAKRRVRTYPVRRTWLKLKQLARRILKGKRK